MLTFFTSPLPKVMSYYGAKGLTFDSVFMPRLVSSSFRNTSPERIARLLFVAITRATNWCYLSTDLERPFPLLVDKLVPLSETGEIKLLKGRGLFRNQKSMTTQGVTTEGSEERLISCSMSLPAKQDAPLQDYPSEWLAECEEEGIDQAVDYSLQRAESALSKQSRNVLFPAK